MRLCEVKNCGLKHFALGYCRKHHIRFKRNGTTESRYDVNSYAPIDDTRDHRPGHRGSYAVNVINDIKFKATQRGKIWNLNHQEAFTLITSNCYYCGFSPQWPHSRVGIDRINNVGPYEAGNVASCCFTCNSAKKELTVEQFKEWVERIYKNRTKW